MSRRTQAPKRTILPDPKYGSELLVARIVRQCQIFLPDLIRPFVGAGLLPDQFIEVKVRHQGFDVVGALEAQVVD